MIWRSSSTIKVSFCDSETATMREIYFPKNYNFLNISHVEHKSPASKAIYDETNRFVEKWCGIGVFVFVQLSSIGIVAPKAVISYVVYFGTNAGSEAFELPLFFW